MSHDPTVRRALSDAELRQAIDSCDREPIHVPGAIQPHGYLLVLDARLTVRLTSANCTQLWRDRQLVGKAATDLFATAELEALVAALEEEQSLTPTRYREARLAHDLGTFHAVLHCSGPGFVLELERVSDAERREAPRAQDLFGRVAHFTTALQQVTSQGQLHQHVVNEIRALTGFDRVKLYRFDAEWNGEVIAESRARHMTSYLGLRFPASDIPQQARALYAKNFIRLIPDVDATPVALTPSDRWPLGNAPVDLTHSVLRAVSPVHLEYLRNMEVGASMSVSIMQHDQLWGLIACHHASPLRIPYPKRMVAELVGHTFSAVLSNTTRHDAQSADDAREAALRELTAALGPDKSLLQALKGQQQRMLKALGADGVIVRVQSKTLSFGVVPELRAIEGFKRWLEEHHEARVFHAHSLIESTGRSFFPPSVACGAMVAPVSRAMDDFVMWFRAEESEEVSWAGRPEKQIARDAAGYHLSPRASFGRWRQIVRGRSLPWVPSDWELGERIADIVIGKRFADSLRQAHDDLRSVLDNSNAYIVITDPQGRVLSMNSQLVEDLGVDLTRATGEPLGEVLPVEMAQRLDENRAAILRDHTPTHFGFAMRHGTRQQQHFITAQFPLYDAYDDIYAICSIANDVSELRLTQQQLEQANSELEQFAYIASHDLRAPMRGIDNLAQWISEDLAAVMDEQTSDRLRLLRSRVGRLETLLDDILRYSRVGKVAQPPETVQIRDLLAEIIDELSAPAGFSITVQDPLPTLVTVPSQLRQIFSNLITNAIKHHDQTSGSVTISAEESDEYAQFAVTDDGPGIAPRFHERIFRMFQTLKSRDEVEGSGLGLAIVRKLVMWYGGKCWIESEDGKRGTTVHFTWPKDMRTKDRNDASHSAA